MQLLTVPLSCLRPNPWNPNRMDDRHFAAEIESIRTFGFIDPITVRDDPDESGAYQIVDGEHRYRALVHLYESEDLPLLPYQDEIPIASLGPIDEATAKRLTLVLNETRGEAPRADMARLLVEIEAELGADEALRGLPIDTSELDDLLELARFDPSLPSTAERSFGDTVLSAHPHPGGDGNGSVRAEGQGEEADDADDAYLHRITALLSDDDLATVRAAREIVQGQETLPRDSAGAWGVVVARLAAAYVDAAAEPRFGRSVQS